MENDLKLFYDNLFKEYPDMVDVKTMCKMLGGISTKTGYKLLKENKIEYCKIGRAYFISKYHILCYLNIIHSDECTI